jgi:cholesterol transport system auxiliary component
MTGAARGAAVAAALVLLTGCAATRSAPPVHTFGLTYPAPEPERSTPLPVVVRVLPFGIASTYDQKGFVYRSGAYGVSVDYYNRWVGYPASLVTDLVARDLAASKSVQAVLQTPSALPSDYEITGRIETLEEGDEGGSCSAQLRLRIVLVAAPSAGARQVVMQDAFAADEPCRRGDPTSYAEAMSRAVQRASDAIRAAVLQAIEQNPPRSPSAE